MAHALQRKLASIDVSDPHLYQDDTWRPACGTMDCFASLAMTKERVENKNEARSR
jgi:hypothetical protein